MATVHARDAGLCAGKFGNGEEEKEPYFLGKYFCKRLMPGGQIRHNDDTSRGIDNFERLEKGPLIISAESLVISSSAESKRGRSQSLTEAEVLGNMFFYVMAGFGTISTALSFVFLLLALHPLCQALLHHQVDQVLGSKPLSEWNAGEDLQ